MLLDLAENLEGSGREIVADNLFVSGEAADALYAKKLYLTGTVRSSRRELPKEFLPCKKREVNSKIVAHNGVKTLTSFVCRQNRAVVFLSTNPELADETPSADHGKPLVNTHYNVKKCGVDQLDKVTKEYSCSKPTKRWPMALFYSIFEMLLHNAYVLFTTKFPQWEKGNNRRKEIFLKDLAYRLVKNQVERRLEGAQSGGVHNDTKADMARFIDELGGMPENYREIRGCDVCSSSKKLNQCGQCCKTICAKHLFKRKMYTCIVCLGEKPKKQRRIEGGTICFYCIGKKRKSKIICSSCETCVCKQHRVHTVNVVCLDCKSIWV